MEKRVRKTKLQTEDGEVQEIQVEEPIPVEQPTEPLPTVPVKTLIRWKKVGGGAFVLNNRYIKPGQVFTAFIDDIPAQFRDVIIPLDETSEIDPLVQHVPSLYTLEEAEGGWNILDSFGKVLNEKILTKDIAERILKTL
jgi:hypothetical protein